MLQHTPPADTLHEKSDQGLLKVMYQYVASALSFVISSCVQDCFGPSSCVVGLDLDVV